MTKILTSPYEQREGWELNVMRANETMYFEEHLSEARLKEKEAMEPRHRLQSYYGYAFESYCTSETPIRDKAPPNSSDPSGWGGDVDTNVQWCSVVRTKLGNTRLLIGGEVDCVRGKYTGQTDTFVELKTSLTIRGPHDEAKFEKKLLKFYFQSFLLGVPEILVGFRTPSGIVTTTQSFKTIHIPRLVRGKPGAWDPLVCLEWGHRFLTFLKDAIKKDADPSNGRVPVWRVKFMPGTGVSVEMLDHIGIEEVRGNEERVGFLPTWYWDELQTKGTHMDPRPRDKEKCGTKPPSDAPLANASWQI
ncbi:RAI1 like PD-XK nuclease-domain-containing protein [Collybia nuda]|uniref:Decapping nuclease n=1 Tax=Collybia nuda TaxID=64659 RepID=A0A9P6CHN8_9AGAR|nr:RAI1 like PD-XK nuclease-domain-containing protein [Collybia nuda]